MVIRRETAWTPPTLVGIAGAGPRAVDFARVYEAELLPGSRFAKCSVLTLDSPWPEYAAVSIVIAFADEAGVRGELAAWARQLQSSSPQLALFCIVGDLGAVRLPGPMVLIPADAATDVQLTAFLNCVAQMLVCRNLINLRVCELREVCAEARQLFFASGLGSGEERARDALDKALATQGTRERIASAQGIWAQVAAPNLPMLWEINQVAQALKDSVRDDAVLWIGGTELQAEGNLERVSMLISTR
jgi:hypothetical protein